jgi:hypothetical protein
MSAIFICDCHHKKIKSKRNDNFTRRQFCGSGSSISSESGSVGMMSAIFICDCPSTKKLRVRKTTTSLEGSFVDPDPAFQVNPDPSG